VHEQVNQAVDLVVQLQRGSDGTRRVVEVAALTSRRREDFVLQPLMRWRSAQLSEGVLRGDFERLPVPPSFASLLAGRGESLPEGYAVAPAGPDLLAEQAARPW